MNRNSNNGVSRALRHLIAERDSYTCVLCNNHYSDVHHYIPRSQGGRNVPYNLVSVCRPCHMKLHGDLGTTRADLDERGDMEQRILEYLSDYYWLDELYRAYIWECYD